MTSGWFRMFSHLYSAKEFMLYVKSPAAVVITIMLAWGGLNAAARSTPFIFLDRLLHIWRSLNWCLHSCRPKVNHTLDKITFFEHFFGWLYGFYSRGNLQPFNLLCWDDPAPEKHFALNRPTLSERLISHTCPFVHIGPFLHISFIVRGTKLWSHRPRKMLHLANYL